MGGQGSETLVGVVRGGSRSGGGRGRRSGSGSNGGFLVLSGASAIRPTLYGDPFLWDGCRPSPSAAIGSKRCAFPVPFHHYQDTATSAAASARAASIAVPLAVAPAAIRRRPYEVAAFAHAAAAAAAGSECCRS